MDLYMIVYRGPWMDLRGEWISKMQILKRSKMKEPPGNNSKASKKERIISEYLVVHVWWIQSPHPLPTREAI